MNTWNNPDGIVFEELQYRGEDSWNRRSVISYANPSSLVELGSIFFVGEGMQTGSNEAFEVLAEEVRDVPRFCRPRLEGKIIKRYQILQPRKYLIWVEGLQDFREAPKWIRDQLLKHEITLRSRAAFQRGNCEWFKFTWPLHKDLYDQPKIWTSYRNASNAFAMDSSPINIGLTDTTVIFGSNRDYWLPTVLGLLNSMPFTLIYRSIGKMTGGGIYEYFKNGVGKIRLPEEIQQYQPIPIPDQFNATHMLVRRNARLFVETVPEPKSISARLLILSLIGHLASVRSQKETGEGTSSAEFDQIEECIDRLTCKILGVDWDDQWSNSGHII
jgi:hypothetical protein